MGTGVESKPKDIGLAIKVTGVRLIDEEDCIIPGAVTEPNAHRRLNTIAAESTVAPIVELGNPALNVLAIYLSIRVLERASDTSHAEPRSLLKISGSAGNGWKGTLRFYQRRGGHNVL